MRELPAEFHARLAALEDAYLAQVDPIRRSGFAGGLERWRAEREPILTAVDRSGSLLDLGCANGFLLESLVTWGQERGLILDPYGVDCGARLVGCARDRFPELSSHFFAANAWSWKSPRQFDFVYTLYDNVPPAFLREYVARVLGECVAPGGLLILGAYGREVSRPSHRSPGFARSGRGGRHASSA
jgi:SAM-dependent methyltransferase